jgi:hypothetical protein
LKQTGPHAPKHRSSGTPSCAPPSSPAPIELHGETFISKTSVTSATFRNTPDVPFESIEVNVPMGPYSEFGANLPPKDNYDFCGQKLKMPTFFKAQNGLEVHQNTPLSITGGPKAKKATKAARKHAHASHKNAN